MGFELPKQVYTGKIRETVIGTGPKALTLGGEGVYPFHVFEGEVPNPPKVGMEIWDYDPSAEWPSAVVEPFKDVIGSPEKWAQKCVNEYGADFIVIQLKSTDPNGMDRPVEDAVKVVKSVVDAVDVPVVVWGTANKEKDEALLKRIAEECQGKNLALSPVEEGNYKGIGATALAFNHVIVASTPIDVNLAKQLNILLENLGVALNKVIIDPTTGGLGYGLEYSYSVMERIKMAGLTQEDEKLQVPMINNIANEIWKSKEAGLSQEDAPTLGDTEKRGILMEVTAAVSYLLAGSNALILRHPESVRLVKAYISLMLKGGSALDLQGITKKLPKVEVDLAKIAPAPNLEIAKEEKAKAPAKPAEKEAPKEAPKAEAPKVEAKPEPPKVEAAPAPEVAKEDLEAKKRAEEEARIKAELEAKKRAEEEEKKKIEAELKAKLEAEAKAKAEAEAKAKAEEEAKRRAEEEERLLKEKWEKDLEEIKKAREAALQRLMAEMKPEEEVKISRKDMDLMERILEGLRRYHKHQ